MAAAQIDSLKMGILEQIPHLRSEQRHEVTEEGNQHMAAMMETLLMAMVAVHLVQ